MSYFCSAGGTSSDGNKTSIADINRDFCDKITKGRAFWLPEGDRTAVLYSSVQISGELQRTAGHLRHLRVYPGRFHTHQHIHPGRFYTYLCRQLRIRYGFPCTFPQSSLHPCRFVKHILHRHLEDETKCSLERTGPKQAQRQRKERSPWKALVQSRRRSK